MRKARHASRLDLATYSILDRQMIVVDRAQDGGASMTEN